MASRFRNALTVVPPVRIAVGRTGLSTTIRWENANVDKQLAGVASNLRLVGDRRYSGSLPTDRFVIPGTRKEFGDGDIATMTSAGLDDFKALLVATRQREREIRSDAGRARRQLVLSYCGKGLALITLAAAFKPVRLKANNAIALRRAEVATLRDNLASSRISVSFDMDTPIAGPHRELLGSFDELAGSQRKWAVQTTEQIDRVRARSSAGTVISRLATSLRRDGHELVDTQDAPLAFSVQRNGASAYFYPGFVLVAQPSGEDFALIDLKDLIVLHENVCFTEEEAIPQDSTIVRKVWAKSNKNGTRDKRFKDNRELPVMLYGQLHIQSPGGLNEVFMFSRNEASRRFASALIDLKSMLSAGMPRKEVARPNPRLAYDPD